jgi:hypothetical protein
LEINEINSIHLIKKGVRYLLSDNLNGFDTVAETLIDSESGVRTLWTFTKVLLLEHLSYDTEDDKKLLKEFFAESTERFAEFLDTSDDLEDDLVDAFISTVTSDTSLDNRDSVYLTFALVAILLEKTDDIESAFQEAIEQIEEGELDE